MLPWAPAPAFSWGFNSAIPSPVGGPVPACPPPQASQPFPFIVPPIATSSPFGTTSGYNPFSTSSGTPFAGVGSPWSFSQPAWPQASAPVSAFPFTPHVPDASKSSSAVKRGRNLEQDVMDAAVAHEDPAVARRLVRKLEKGIRSISVVESGPSGPPQSSSPSPEPSPGVVPFEAQASDMDDAETGVAPPSRLPCEEEEDDEEEEESSLVVNWRVGPYYRHYLVADAATDARYARSLARSASMLPPPPVSPQAAKSMAMIVYQPPLSQIQSPQAGRRPTVRIEEVGPEDPVMTSSPAPAAPYAPQAPNDEDWDL